MARPLRLEFEHAVYHVTSRGNARQRIVRDDGDRARWLAVLAAVVTRFGWRCYAYCLMNNHYHILIETPQANLARGMRQLNGVYTQRFNRQHRRVGHLFQGRYKAILVEKDAHLLELCRYVVLNPVRAKAARTAAQWPWSSYGATAGETPAPPWLDVDGVWSQFAARPSTAQTRYRRFVADGLGQPSPWEEVTGQVYLGSEAFVRRHHPGDVHREVPLRQRHAVRPPLEKLLPRTRVTPAALLRAYSDHGYRLREIAEHLGVHYATVSRRLRQAERQDEMT